jgi:hypothetical protein
MEIEAAVRTLCKITAFLLEFCNTPHPLFSAMQYEELVRQRDLPGIQIIGRSCSLRFPVSDY